MFDLKAGWNLSFAGCGFLGVYHIGVSSCLLERAPYLVHRAKMICGASAGALSAAMLTSRACTEKCCEDVVELSKEARKRNLGPLHPAFDIIKVLRTGLQRNIPEDAHTQASGKLGVSLTRVSDGKNVLVCHFNSKDELIQALICSCFIPVYCGLIPPAFRGVRYVDGGFSDNLPQSELKNTITVSPFSGESDICPKDNSSSFHELQLTNTSIQVNCGNLDRISKALFPPEPKIMAEMCQQGYKDALRFLEKNNMLSTENPTTDHVLTQDTPAYCCAGINTEPAKWWMLWRLRLSKEHHWWLDEQLVNLLPAALKKVFCDACKEKCSIISQLNCLLPVRVASYILMPYTLPVESTYSAVRRFVKWMPEVPANAQWCFEVAGRAWKCVSKKMGSAILVHWCVSEQPPPKQIHMYTGSDDDS